MIFVKLVLLSRSDLWLHFEQLGSELLYNTVKNLPAVRSIVTISLLVSRAKYAISVNGLLADLVRLNQCRTQTTNVEIRSKCLSNDKSVFTEKYAFSG